MTEIQEHEVVVIGGGPAGATAAIYTTRLGHDTALIDRDGGRASLMWNTHNVIGVTEDTSGREFIDIAAAQLEEYGTQCYSDRVTAVAPTEDQAHQFQVEANQRTIYADRVVLATGFNDKPSNVPMLGRFMGRGLHYCLHCDAYMLVNEPTYVLGHGNSAANVAMIMLNFTDDVDLLLDGNEPEWDGDVDEQVRAHPLDIITEEVVGAFPEDEDADEPWLGGLEFADGTTREYAGGFPMYGKRYNNQLATALGCELADDGAVVVDEHGRTSIDGVYAIGDLTPGHNQIPVAMGEGANAGIAIHKELRSFPKPLDEINARGGLDEQDVPAMPEELRKRAQVINSAESHKGMSANHQHSQ
jgi:thioredoxin reductase (NADPH)